MARQGITREMQMAFDNFANAVTVIQEPHRMIHDGFMFDSSGIATAVANGASLDLLFALPAGQIGHMTTVEFSLDDAPVTASFYEDVTTSADGTAANVQNHNRIVGGSPAAVITVGPTVTDLGTLLHTRYIPSAGAPGQQPAGQLVEGETREWVIGSSTAPIKYMWRVTNNSGGAIDIGYHFNGYEIGADK